MDDIEAVVGVGERSTIGGGHRKAPDVVDRWPGHSRGEEDLRSRVDGGYVEAPIATAPVGQERDGDVRAAGPDVEQRDVRTGIGLSPDERVDRDAGQGHAAQPAVEPAHVAQVAGQYFRIVERPVEQLRGAGDALQTRLLRCTERRQIDPVYRQGAPRPYRR